MKMDFLIVTNKDVKFEVIFSLFGRALGQGLRFSKLIDIQNVKWLDDRMCNCHR